MIQPIYPCLWFDNNAKVAADFYCSVFEAAQIKQSNDLVTVFELAGQKFMTLNGGPMYKPNASISFFVTCETDKEVKELWNKLSVDGEVLMPLDKYHWSDYYGWCADKFGYTWQIYKGKMSEVNQKIVPMLMFTQQQYGKSEEAVNYYAALFDPSEIQGILKYGEDTPQAEGKVVHAQFVLNNCVFMAMDGVGSNEEEFSVAQSFVIECDTQQEIDLYWNHFTKEGSESRCGWCVDKFGVSWQIVPRILGELMSDPNKVQKVAAAFMQMNKFDIATLLKA
jgi:predicted 3-demethylubiquinone-9 3-methyltransferase (glyoxalase superfamily)